MLDAQLELHRGRVVDVARDHVAAARSKPGVVTVTALVGQGGAGFFILDGLGRFFSTEIVLGTALSVMIAVTLDLVLSGVERIATPWARRRAAL